ncbi:MAG: epoxyqueuosine reductase [Candidatus Latescibacteria bacterium]|nr:epoxyqueuosine reductase [Candidatus Latescibacterota bacterium]
MDTLQLQINSVLMDNGASLVGFSDISDLSDDIRHSMNYAVSIAVALDPAIVGNISAGPTLDYFGEYKRVNSLLSGLCRKAGDVIRKNGYNAVTIDPTTENFNLITLTTPLPHKTSAIRAGFGWIGKSALLVTEKYGAAIRLATVLCNAEFDVENTATESKCVECRECVIHCPAKAIAGHNWEPGHERSRVYNAHECRETALTLSGNIGIHATICGICINVCPWTQKYIR